MSTDTIILTVTFLSGALSLVILIQTVRKLRHESAISILMPFVSIGATAFVTLLYWIITGGSINGLIAAPLLVLGLVIGLGEGQLTRLYYRGDAVMGKRSAGYVVLWGLAYLLTMALAQFGSAALHAVGLLTMLFGLGAAVGSNVVLLLKRLTVKPQKESYEMSPL